MSLDALQNTLPPVTTADLEANGRAPMDAPRWRVRSPQYKRVELTGQWAGAWCDMLLNPGIAIMSDLQARVDGPRWHLHRLIRAWNFESADGTPLEVNAESVGQLDDATVVAILNGWHQARDLSKSG